MHVVDIKITCYNRDKSWVGKSTYITATYNW